MVPLYLGRFFQPLLQDKHKWSCFLGQHTILHFDKGATDRKIFAGKWITHKQEVSEKWICQICTTHPTSNQAEDICLLARHAVCPAWCGEIGSLTSPEACNSLRVHPVTSENHFHWTRLYTAPFDLRDGASAAAVVWIRPAYGALHRGVPNSKNALIGHAL